MRIVFEDLFSRSGRVAIKAAGGKSQKWVDCE